MLRHLPLWHAPAPEAMWTAIRAELDAPRAPAAVPLIRRTVPSWLAAAVLLLAVVGGSLVGTLRSFRAPSRWVVQALAGSPAVNGTALARTGDLAAGEWLVTDSTSRARLTVGRIGTVEVGPNSRVRLDRGFTEHRLTVQQGSLHAVVAAPPRLFVVETPSARATDLGCAYVLDVDTTGSSRLSVTAGWVELKGGESCPWCPRDSWPRSRSAAGPAPPIPRVSRPPRATRCIGSTTERPPRLISRSCSTR